MRDLSNSSKADLQEKDYEDIVVSQESPVESKDSYNGESRFRKDDIEASLSFVPEGDGPQLSKKSFLDKFRSNTSMVGDPGPPPDGGRLAWTQAIMAHLVWHAIPPLLILTNKE